MYIPKSKILIGIILIMLLTTTAVFAYTTSSKIVFEDDFLDLYIFLLGYRLHLFYNFIFAFINTMRRYKSTNHGKWIYI